MSEKVNIKYQHFILLLVGSVIIYSELMINQLTNDYDGLWEGSFHNAGIWELSLGRWFWHYISRARFGTSADPYTSLITLAIMGLGLLLLFDLWQIRNKYVIMLSGLLFISHPAICFELSYRYMSPTFGMAFFLSVLAVWCFEKIDNPFAAVLAGSFSIAFSMGSYQAYICCTTVAFLTALLIKLSRNVDWKNIFLFCAKSIIGIILGGIEYIVILKIFFHVNGIGMSGYQGGNNYSIMNSLRCLKPSIQKILQFFELYFKGILYKINRMQGKHLFTIMFILVLILVIINFLTIYRKSKLKAILYGVLIFLYPVATISVLLIATDVGLALQMACGPALFLAALPCLFYYGEYSTKEEWKENEKQTIGERLRRVSEKCRDMLGLGFAFYMAVVLYGSICQVVIDQNTMYQGRIASENIADMVVEKLLQEDLVSDEYRYVFVGTPSAGPLYAIDSNYINSNLYALYGAWFVDSNSAKSWNGIIRNRKGLNLSLVTGPEYERMSTSQMVEKMPLFPEKGSIVLENDVVYVKISDIK